MGKPINMVSQSLNKSVVTLWLKRYRSTVYTRFRAITRVIKSETNPPPPPTLSRCCKYTFPICHIEHALLVLSNNSESMYSITTQVYLLKPPLCSKRRNRSSFEIQVIFIFIRQFLMEIQPMVSTFMFQRLGATNCITPLNNFASFESFSIPPVQQNIFI